MTRIALFSIFLLGSSSALADNSFQHQASVRLDTNSDDMGYGFYALDYEYFFSPVSANEEPYWLSLLFSPSSSLRVNYNRNYGNYGGDGWFGIGGTYQSEFGSFVSADYTRYSNDFYYYELSIGHYLDPLNRIEFLYDNINGTEAYTLDYLGYFELDKTEGVTLNMGLSKQDAGLSDVAVVYVKADWYLNQSWYVGANYEYTNAGSDSYSGDSWSIDTGYWWQIHPNYSAQAVLRRTLDSHAVGVDIYLGFATRF
ncbi:putative porin [Ferrimonas balearica]|uniref:putative porin n=1 Tax=Ferrimonas balearica TaxID=44012 RepID=UPI0031BB4C7B